MIGKPKEYTGKRGKPKKKYERDIPTSARLPINSQTEENTEVEILNAFNDLHIGEEFKDSFIAIKDIKKSSSTLTIKARVVKKGAL